VAAGAGTTAAASCVLAPEQEEGPYYLAGEQIRRDVTDGQAGIPLKLRILLVNGAGCAPLANAAVDIWHANAGGDYSGFGNAASNKSFLRGTQLSDTGGAVEFTTIYPGWYPGRAVHIHVRVHVGGAAGTTYTGGHVAHTGQLFFPDDLTTQVHQLQPYAGHKGSRTMNSQDQVYNGEQGSTFVLNLSPLQSGAMAGGFSATVMMGVDPNATPAAVGGGGAAGGPGGPPPGRGGPRTQ
jgi:protocatechuate 3,4-dioxygenase beta subunit